MSFALTQLEGRLTLAFVLINKKHKRDNTWVSQSPPHLVFSGCCAAIYTGLAAKNSRRRHNYNKKKQRGQMGRAACSVERLKAAMIRVAFRECFKIKILRPDGGKNILLDFFYGMLTWTFNYI